MKKDTGTDKKLWFNIISQLIQIIWNGGEEIFGNITNPRDSSPSAKEKGKKGEVHI